MPDQSISNCLINGGMLEEQQAIADILNAGVDRPSVLFWRYDDPAVIMGCSQRPSEDQIERAHCAKLPIHRRKSGGGAVFAGPWMLSVTVFMPADYPQAKLDIIQSFGWLEQVWIKALKVSGVDCKGVDIALIERSKEIAEQHDINWACYASLSHGEIVSPDNKKLVGIAQIRKRKGVALVCGLHLQDCDWRTLSDVVANKPDQAEVLSSLNTYAQALNDQDIGELLPSIMQNFMHELPVGFSPLSSESIELPSNE